MTKDYGEINLMIPFIFSEFYNKTYKATVLFLEIWKFMMLILIYMGYTKILINTAMNLGGKPFSESSQHRTQILFNVQCTACMHQSSHVLYYSVFSALWYIHMGHRRSMLRPFCTYVWYWFIKNYHYTHILDMLLVERKVSSTEGVNE